MAKTYEQIQQQIADLQVEAERLRRKELDGVIGRIREAIDFYELTAADLGFGAKSTKKTALRQKKATKNATPKVGKAAVTYSNGSGGSWGGRGKRPQWLRDALAAGRTLDEFRDKPEAG